MDLSLTSHQPSHNELTSTTICCPTANHQSQNIHCKNCRKSFKCRAKLKSTNCQHHWRTDQFGKQSTSVAVLKCCWPAVKSSLRLVRSTLFLAPEGNAEHADSVQHLGSGPGAFVPRTHQKGIIGWQWLSKGASCLFSTESIG